MQCIVAYQAFYPLCPRSRHSFAKPPRFNTGFFFGGKHYAHSKICSGGSGGDEFRRIGPVANVQRSIDRSASAHWNRLAARLVWTSRLRSKSRRRNNRHTEIRRRRKSEWIDGL